MTALGAAPAARAADAQSPALERVAREAPLGRTLEFKEPKLSDFDDKVVVVSFWASWCAPCREEFPYLERLQMAGAGKLQVISVNTEERKIFVRLHKILSADMHLLMTYDYDGECAKAFQAPNALPYTVVLKRDRTVAGIKTGWGDSSLRQLVDLVNAAMA